MNKLNFKNIIKIIIGLFFLTPIIMITYNSFLGLDKTWYFLLEYGIINTLLVCFGSLIVSLFIGLPSAIILGLFNIRFSKFFIWIFILTLIIPGYTLALLYSDYFSFFFSIYGLMIILGIASSPYIFLSIYTSIINTSKKYIISAQSLGLSMPKIIYKILIPLLKPSIILGSLIVIAESSSDFGASFFLGVNTLMVNIYNLYFSIYDKITGSQFSLILISIVFLIYFSFKPFKNKIHKFTNELSNDILIGENKIDILGYKTKILIYFYLIFIISIIFIIPVIILCIWLYKSLHVNINIHDYLIPLKNTIGLLFISLFFINILGYTIVKLFRKNNIIMNLFNIIYSIPGLIIGISILNITPYINSYIGSYIFLLLGLSIKITPLVISNLYSQYIKISPKFRKVWYSLGRSKLEYIFKIEIPLLKKGLLSTSALIFIEIIRELPITLILQPFGFETLATKIFFFQSSEQLELSAFWILSMIILTIIPIIYLYRNKFKY